ncbi:hypothetical protein O7619_04100 [Micromonospora sp. WMMD998]|nr:hypothetical protein [Micromonospora sp. WMMD998]WFE37661.1 hypothetical protein O7619_04100 [Micromonospora sp. WMMD998]
MARRGWGGSTAAALGVAAGAGAAQLGFGYGLGIINWAPTGAVRIESAWVASLAWATWIAATSVIAGAVCAQRLRGGDEPSGTLPRLGLALAAGVGALVTVLLVAVPARAARVPDTSAPQTVAAAYAAAGLVLGVLLATWALHTRAAATNLIATTGWLWLLAVVSVVDGVLSGRGLTTAQLGIWQISADSARFWIRDYFYWPGALLSLGSALVIGVLAARRAVRSPRVRIGAAASGAAGPLLVALAYLLAVPRLAGIAAEQLSAHLIAPYAVMAGVGGSVLVAALAQRADRRAADDAPVTGSGELAGEPATAPARHGEAEPTAHAASEPGGAASEPGSAASEPGSAASEPGSAASEPGSAAAEPAGGGKKPAGRFFRRRATAGATLADRSTGEPHATASPDVGDRTGATDATTTPVGRRPDKAADTGPETTAGTGSKTAVSPGRRADDVPDPGTTAGPRPRSTAAAKPDTTVGTAGRVADEPGGGARSGADRRGRAVPRQRQPEGEPGDDPAAGRDEKPRTDVSGRDEDVSGRDESDAEDRPVGPASPAVEPKARRRAR